MKMKEAIGELKRGNCAAIRPEFSGNVYVLNEEGEVISLNGRDTIPRYYYETQLGPRDPRYVGEWALLKELFR